MRKITDYILAEIAENESWGGVQKAGEEGWQPFGNPFGVVNCTYIPINSLSEEKQNGDVEYHTTFFQAFVKYEGGANA